MRVTNFSDFILGVRSTEYTLLLIPYEFETVFELGVQN